MADKKHGHWIVRLADGSVFEGSFVTGNQHGKWVVRKPNGNTEEACFENLRPARHRRLSPTATRRKHALKTAKLYTADFVTCKPSTWKTEMNAQTIIFAIATALFATSVVAQVASAAICQGQDAEFNPADGAKDGATPLHIAASANACESAARLLAKGANVNAHDKINRTPLYFVTKSNAVETAKSLIAYGADVNASTNGIHRYILRLVTMPSMSQSC